MWFPQNTLVIYLKEKQPVATNYVRQVLRIAPLAGHFSGLTLAIAAGPVACTDASKSNYSQQGSQYFYYSPAFQEPDTPIVFLFVHGLSSASNEL